MQNFGFENSKMDFLYAISMATDAHKTGENITEIHECQERLTSLPSARVRFHGTFPIACKGRVCLNLSGRVTPRRLQISGQRRRGENYDSRKIYANKS
ncbi:hypothetical protein AV530_012579 [Patagioenas fasciata monilis]|uniref:Uncharacterized protein n=1 Tax=Patagioenas fasciata monilis TaxID=372326 RepID=A0A1V4JBT3_PATFA|nr:hypothetical protein AV530_012579 [Patagioenas fasciata monilis]